jgi:hypothetical protein
LGKKILKQGIAMNKNILFILLLGIPSFAFSAEIIGMPAEAWKSFKNEHDSISVIEYDDKTGKELKVKSFNKSGLTQWTLNSYYKDRLVKTDYYDRNNNLISFVIYALDNEGKTQAIVYDNNGQIISKDALKVIK